MNRIIRASAVALSIALAMAFAASSAFAADPKEEAKGWTGEVSASGAIQPGTVRTIAITGDAETNREWENDNVNVRLVGTYGFSDEDDSKRETTQDNQSLTGKWKHRFFERFFTESRSQISRNSTQDRRIRFMANVGPGYRVWKGEDPAKHHFDLSSGVGYRYEVYDGNKNNAGVVGVIGTDTDIDHFVDFLAAFEYKNMLFEDRIEFTHTGGIAVPGNSPSAFLARTEVIIGVPLTASWSFRTTFLLEYTNEVPDDVKETMTRTTLGLGYKF